MKTRVLVDTLKFPESPRWHEGRFWCCDLFTNQVVKVDLSGHVQQVIEPNDMPSAVGWTPEGHLLLTSANARQLLRLDGDTLVNFADLSDLVAHPLNDMVVDGQGRVYIGSTGYDFGESPPVPAPILLVMPDGSVRTAAEGLAFPNGMVITPDGHTLIVAESHAACLTAFTIEADGLLSHRRLWAQFESAGDFSSTQITPDGICLDAEGAVWIASPNTKEILRVREGAEVADRIRLDNIPLACMLGGLERRTLFITTTESLDPSDAHSKGRVEALQVNVQGVGFP